MDSGESSQQHLDNEAIRDESWLDLPSQEEDDAEIDEFDIVSSPNDWNFLTIVNFLESGSMKIPAFQRNYVWDRKRASKLIESLLIGLPVPQVFLYEESRNSFLVIDGQQRLLSLYFFSKGRFPRSNMRGHLRSYIEKGYLDDGFMENDELFEPFKLSLPKAPSGKTNRFHGLTYKGLGDYKTSLDLRTIRNTVVKQTSPEGNSAVFEIFSRLNTGGVNLSPQEIRASLYHSNLYTRVLDLNSDPVWRRIVGRQTPDARMRDTEFLLRSLSLAENGGAFSGSMANFINNYCFKAKKFDSHRAESEVRHLQDFIKIFDGADSPFMRQSKFSGVLFESHFAAWSRLDRPSMSSAAMAKSVEDVKRNEAFAKTLQEGSTKPVNIKARIRLAEESIESQL